MVYSNKVILNFLDKSSEPELLNAKALIEEMNPSAKIFMYEQDN